MSQSLINLPEKERIYDVFLFFNEFDVLELRLKTLDSVVDIFVLVESPETHSGQPKPLYFQENKARFEPWLHKIRHVVIDKWSPERYNPQKDANGVELPISWKRENFAREEMIKGLHDAQPNDIIFQSDCDEIWRPELAFHKLDERKVTTFRSGMFYYFLNCQSLNESWNLGPKRVRFKHWPGGQKLRIPPMNERNDEATINNAGWHFSYAGDAEKIHHKLKSFAHEEYSTDFWTDKERIKKKISSGDDLFNRDRKFTTISIDKTFPQPLLDEPQRWAHLIKPVSSFSNVDIVTCENTKILNPDNRRDDVLFAIPTLNRYQHLTRILNVINDGTVRPGKFLIIDNGGMLVSEVEKNGWKLPEGCEIFNPGKNLGVAASWNVALRRGFKYTVIGSDDCIPESDVIEQLVKSADDTKNPTMYSPTYDGKISISVFFLQSKNVTDKVGFYDERFYPGYYEDNDYHRRMKLQGLIPYSLPFAKARHIDEGGATIRQFDQRKLLRDNEQLYIEKWGGTVGRETITNIPPIKFLGYFPPLISVIIPHLSEVDGEKLEHREEGLRLCIKSIKSQTYPQDKIQIIVVDGLETVPEKLEKGLMESTGQFIVYAANDMEMSPDAIELAWLESMERNCGLVSFNSGRVGHDEGNICEHFMIRRDFIGKLERGQIFSTDFHHAGCDNWLWAQAKRLNQAYRSDRAKVVHHHFSTSTKPMDNVYKKGWNKYSQDREILQKKLEGLR